MTLEQALGISLIGLNGKAYGLPASLWIAMIQIAERNSGYSFTSKSHYSQGDCEAIAKALRTEAEKLPPSPTKGGIDALLDRSFYIELADFLDASGGIDESD